MLPRPTPPAPLLPPAALLLHRFRRGHRSRRATLASVLLFCVGALPAATLANRIRSVLNSTPVGRTAFWGIEVADLNTGRILYRQNADRFFVPASNVKLFITAAALEELGPSYQVRTRIVQEGKDLVLYGAGDANLSGRKIPYEPNAPSASPLTVIDALAAKLAAHGLKQVEGNIVGDDTAFVWEPYGEGWTVEDPLVDDGTAVSALAVNDNSLALSLRPGLRAGDPAQWSLDPNLPVFDLDAHVITSAAGPAKLLVEREPGSRRLRLSGVVVLGDPPQIIDLGIDDPARFAALALKDALLRHGVAVNGEALPRHLYSGSALAASLALPGTPLVEQLSPPLLEDLRIIDKVSQNLHAEMLLRTLGRAQNGIGSVSAGLERVAAFLDRAGLARDQYRLHDGSGLSRYDLATPHALVQLLRYMATSERRDPWIGLLPVGGLDGTLAARFTAKRARGRIHAKTGTLGQASALSGYIDRRDGHTLAFSILVNNSAWSTTEARAAADKICMLLLE